MTTENNTQAPCQGCGEMTDPETTLCFSCSIEWAQDDANEEDYERENNPDYEDDHAYNSYGYGYEQGVSEAWGEINTHRFIRWYLQLVYLKNRVRSKIRKLIHPRNMDDIPF